MSDFQFLSPISRDDEETLPFDFPIGPISDDPIGLASPLPARNVFKRTNPSFETSDDDERAFAFPLNPEDHDPRPNNIDEDDRPTSSATLDRDCFERDDDCNPDNLTEPEPVTTVVNRMSPTYLVPSAVMEMSTLKAGSFVAGYVLDSSGSGILHSIPSENGNSNSSNSKSPSKKRRGGNTVWHALFIADEKNVVKFWARAQASAAPSRDATVNRLSKVNSGHLVAINLQSGPIEVSISNPSYKKYDLCTKDCEVMSIKIRILEPKLKVLLPEFRLAESEAYNVSTWEEIDSVVHTGGHSFEVNCTFAVVGVNGRHTLRKARKCSRYLTGYIQDFKGVSRVISVFAQIEHLLKAVPEDVNVKHVVFGFKRLRIRIMANCGPSTPSRVASLTANTSFQLLQTSYEEFSKQAPDGAIDFADLEGFE